MEEIFSGRLKISKIEAYYTPFLIAFNAIKSYFEGFDSVKSAYIFSK